MVNSISFINDQNNLDIEMGTLIYEELSLRKSSSSKKILKDLLSKFSSVGHEPIKWLKDARSLMKKIRINKKTSLPIFGLLLAFPTFPPFLINLI